MTMEEIYSHFQIPPMDKTNALFNTTYTKDAGKRVKKQQKKLNKKITQILEMFIEREMILFIMYLRVRKTQSYIFLFISIELMNNVEKQLYIQGDFIVDITPLEVIELVEETLENLSIRS